MRNVPGVVEVGRECDECSGEGNGCWLCRGRGYVLVAVLKPGDLGQLWDRMRMASISNSELSESAWTRDRVLAVDSVVR